MWTTAQLRSQGTPKSDILRMRKAAHKIRRGTYTDDPEGPWEIYRLRCLAVGRAIRGAVLAGPSAAVVWGLATVDDPPDFVYIRGVTPGRYGEDVKVISGGTPETTVHRNEAVTTVAWTIVDCARVLTKRDALILADCALHRRWCSLDALREAAGSLGRAKGIARVRWVMANADPNSESPGETWLRMIVAEAGYAVRSQVRITKGDFRARVDLVIDGTNVILEFDGLIKYNETDEGAARQAIVDERRRQADLELMGYRVVRFIWEQLHELESTIARVELAVSRSGASVVHGQQAG
jgi:very-short-patch-repair endonuclease